MSIEAKKRLDTLKSSAVEQLQWSAEEITHCEDRLSELAEVHAELAVQLTKSKQMGNDFQSSFSEEQERKISELISAYSEQLREYQDVASKAKKMLWQAERLEQSIAYMSLEDRETVDRLLTYN